MTKIKIIQSDITKIEADAIVSAANQSLEGGKGVNGAIHRIAGSKLLEELKGLGSCKTGEAKITKGYNLPAKYIIHTVGPIYGDARINSAKLLADCYKNSLELAKVHNLRSIAFPCIATGAYGYPKDEAANVAINTIKEFINQNPDIFEKIIFVAYGELDFNIYTKLI